MNQQAFCDLGELRQAIRQFAAERDWNQFHTPKNLAMALTVEAAELLEHFQWLTPEQSLDLPGQARQQVAEECADILVYLVRLADRLDLDLLQAAAEKMQLNARKYPVEKARGRANKYTDYLDDGDSDGD